MDIFLVVVVFFGSANGIPEMTFTEVIGDKNKCEAVAREAYPSLADELGAKNIISLSCTEKFPYKKNRYSH